MGGRVWCSQHDCHPMECFFQHSGQVVAEEVVEEPLQMIVLPCHHLHRRPVKMKSQVECQCGKRWKLELEDSGRTWEATEVVG